MRKCDSISFELGGRSEIRATTRTRTENLRTTRTWPAHRRNALSDIRRTRVRVQALTQHLTPDGSRNDRALSSADSHRLAF